MKEVWLLDPKTREHEIYVLRGRQYFAATADRSGITHAPLFALDFQTLDGPKLRITAADAAWTMASRYETDQNLTYATKWARRAAKLSGPDERRIRKVMTMLDAAGDRAGAIAVYEEFARYLASELEVEPSDETRALAETIRKRKSG